MRKYIAHRQAQGIIGAKGKRKGERLGDVSNAEINRELTVLRRMFSIALKDGLLMHRSHFPMLAENNTRTGFFEPEQIASVLTHLPTALQPVVEFAHLTGWRVAAEESSRSNGATSSCRLAKFGWTRTRRRTARAACSR